MKPRPYVRVGGALLWLVGCNAGADDKSVAKPEACDAALAKLGRELESATAWDGSRRVWPGLESACGDTIPKPLAAYFRSFDPDNPQVMGGDTIRQVGKFKRRACPDIDTIMSEAVALPQIQRATMVYQACDFARYEVIDERDAIAETVGGLMVFTFHQWMLDEGIEADAARPITRALFGLQSLESMASPLSDDFEMPAADGMPIERSPTLIVTAKGAMLNGRELVRFGDEFKIRAEDRGGTSLFGYLGQEAEKEKQMAAVGGAEWDGALLLVADARTPYRTLTDLLVTADRADFSRILIVTSRPTFGFGVTALQPELRGAAVPEDSGLNGMSGAEPTIAKMARDGAQGDAPQPDEPPPFLALHLAVDGFTLSTPGIAEGKTTHDVAQLETITKRAADVAASNASSGGVVVSADPDVRLSRIVSALEAARGPDCTPEGEGCLLTAVTLVRSDAHAYRPTDGPTEGAWGGLTDEEIGDAYRLGGLGLVGTSRGDGDEGTIGFGNMGLGGTDDGTPVPKLRKAKAKVKGDLDKDIVRRVIQAHANEVRLCYKRGLLEDPKLSGRVKIEFIIDGRGKVSKSEVQSNSIKGDEVVGPCIARVVKRWKFPKPEDGEDVVVAYPFSLEPG